MLDLHRQLQPMDSEAARERLQREIAHPAVSDVNVTDEKIDALAFPRLYRYLKMACTVAGTRYGRDRLKGRWMRIRQGNSVTDRRWTHAEQYWRK